MSRGDVTTTNKPTMKSGKRHSKKRNVGLVYQFLVRHVTEATLRDDVTAAAKTTKILREHFRSGTELYKEWRLFNAVIKTQGLSDASATAILRETRAAAIKVNVRALDVEKMRLIDAVSRNLGVATFEHVVPTYKMYATVQTLFNDWRASAPDIVRIVDYEGKLFEHLTSQLHVDVNTSTSSPADDALVVRLMTEKFNNKYTSKLTPRQRMLLAAYTSDGPSSQALASLIAEAKDDALKLMTSYMQSTSDKHMTEKLGVAMSVVEDIDVTHGVDGCVIQGMKLCELINELSQFGQDR
jgi:hypothetical protein